MNYPKEAQDVEFFQAVMKCAMTLTPTRVEGEYKDGDNLANFLKSDYHLSRTDRELLADLVTGELQRPHSRPSVGVGLDHIANTVKHFIECRESGDPEKVALYKAQKFLKDKYDKIVKDSQLRSWIAETKKRNRLTPK